MHRYNILNINKILFSTQSIDFTWSSLDLVPLLKAVLCPWRLMLTWFTNESHKSHNHKGQVSGCAQAHEIADHDLDWYRCLQYLALVWCGAALEDMVFLTDMKIAVLSKRLKSLLATKLCWAIPKPSNHNNLCNH